MVKRSLLFGISVVALGMAGCTPSPGATDCGARLDSLQAAASLRLDSARGVIDAQARAFSELQGRESALEDSLRGLREELDRRNRPVPGKPEFIQIPKK